MEERFALLIDADNVSAKYIKPILDELSKYGNVTYKRIYGDWTRPNSAGWKEELLQNSITPIQQFSYTYGKNATDSAMIIDAMDMLYASELEGFCLVSSDSDFTRLASRLRESGKRVIGMGEAKTPLPFRKACEIFTELELLLEDNMMGVSEREEKTVFHTVSGKESFRLRKNKWKKRSLRLLRRIKTMTERRDLAKSGAGLSSYILILMSAAMVIVFCPNFWKRFLV